MATWSSGRLQKPRPAATWSDVRAANITTPYTGGCLCGALRYEAHGEHRVSGHCYYQDCRKASGSDFIPFMGFPATAIRFTGEYRRVACSAANGKQAVRNFCPACGRLVFGGIIGQS